MDRQSNLRRDLSDALSQGWASLDVELGAATHPGHVRENNEDSYLLMRFGRSLERLATSLDEHLMEQNYTINGYGLLVADGMGGMAAGEVASRMAIVRLVDLVVDTSDWTLELKRNKDVKTVFERMTQRFYQIDRTLRDEAKNDDTLYGMGTTLTVAGTLGNDLVLGHVGDSRAYLLRGTIFRQLTRDHTLAQALIDAGVANSDDPAPRSMRHVLTAAIGSLDERIEPQVQRFRLAGGDQLLLCTDGLTEMVNDESIAGLLREAPSAQLACDGLVDLALGAGGSDNITVVLARFSDAASPPL
jgi:serine/threonine protein phosphatase PrpC